MAGDIAASLEGEKPELYYDIRRVCRHLGPDRCVRVVVPLELDARDLLDQGYEAVDRDQLAGAEVERVGLVAPGD